MRITIGSRFSVDKEPLPFIGFVYPFTRKKSSQGYASF
jgi:hypothetical protein